VPKQSFYWGLLGITPAIAFLESTKFISPSTLLPKNRASLLPLSMIFDKSGRQFSSIEVEVPNLGGPKWISLFPMASHPTCSSTSSLTTPHLSQPLVLETVQVLSPPHSWQPIMLQLTWLDPSQPPSQKRVMCYPLCWEVFVPALHFVTICSWTTVLKHVVDAMKNDRASSFVNC